MRPLLVGVAATLLACTAAHDPGPSDAATVTVVASPPTSSSAAPVQRDPAIRAISAGTYSTCVLAGSGKARCWGTVMYTISGVPEPNHPVRGSAPFDLAGVDGARALYLGTYFGCAVGSENRMACFGNVPWGYGEDQVPPYAPENLSGGGDVASIAVGSTSACTITKKGQVRCWGSSDLLARSANVHEAGDPTPIAGLSDVEELALGTRHACARKHDGSVVCWGDNKRGQLGDGTRAARVKPVAVEGLPDKVIALAAGGASEEPVERRVLGDFTCALLADSTVTCWGSNEMGQLGTTDVEWRTEPQRVPSVRDAVAVSAGTQHACALGRNGTVTCWGRNHEGQVASVKSAPHAPPTEVAGVTDAVLLAAGGHHTCVATRSDKVLCWGHNLHGERGDPDSKSLGAPHVVEGAVPR